MHLRIYYTTVLACEVLFSITSHFVKGIDAFVQPISESKPMPCSTRTLPNKILIGYSTECNDRVVQAVRDGLNVIIWSFMEIHRDVDQKNEVDGIVIEMNSLDLDKIRSVIDRLDREGYDDTIHLVSFGGWNGPHLDSKLGASEWYEAWRNAVGSIFHGIDWDLEGHDNLESPTNVFSNDCLEKMGKISRLAKQDGYIIGMAPPQSYLDISNPHFSRAVNLKEPDRPWHGDFHYFGANVYAYLLARYGDYIDFVSIQFYESYSRAAMSVFHENIDPAVYLESYVRDLVARGNSFPVNFEQDPSTELSNQQVSLPLSKLVFGFANGWALDTNQKAIYFEPTSLHNAYKNLAMAEQAPRGFMFWVLGEEGTNGVSYTRELNKILQTRLESTLPGQEAEL